MPRPTRRARRPRTPPAIRKWLPALAFLVALPAPCAFGRGGYNLPRGAVVVETRAVRASARGGRTLVLWMLRPTRHPRGAPDEIYTCPEETRGHHYSGPTRVSLADARTRRVINTVELKEAHDGTDSLDIPYRIRAGGHYHVPGVRRGREGRPAIMRLRDYNGDGRALEFALYDAWACMGLETTLVGYSERRDRVVQYPIHLTVRGGERESSVSPWADYLFSRPPVRPGHWKYRIDYRGRGGSLDIYDVRYDARNERFVGTLTFAGQE